MEIDRLEELSTQELKETNGGYNLPEAIVYGIAWVTRKLADSGYTGPDRGR